MDKLNQLKIQLKNDLPKKGVKNLINSLKEILPEFSPKYDLLILIETAYKAHHLKTLKKVLTEEEVQRVNAEIQDRLLTLISELTPEDFEENTTPTNFSKDKTYQKGHVLYQIPKQMQVFHETRCRVRIAFDEMMLMEDLEDEKDIEIKSEVRVSDYMKVEIIDPTDNETFEIRSSSEPVQFIDQDDFTEWRFYVKPLLPGEHVLELKVSVIVLINGKEVKREKTLEESVVIIAEKVEEIEPPFVKTMEEMVMPIVPTKKGEAFLPHPLPYPEPIPPPRSSGVRLPKSLKTMAMGLLMLMIASTASYAFVPAIQLEADYFWADKIVGSKSAYEKFEKKYEKKRKASPRVERRLKVVNKEIEKIELNEFLEDNTEENAKDYLKRSEEGRKIIQTFNRIGVNTIQSAISHNDTSSLTKLLEKNQSQLPEGISQQQVSGFFKKLQGSQNAILPAIKNLQSALVEVERKDTPPTRRNEDPIDRQSSKEKTTLEKDQSPTNRTEGQQETPNKIPAVKKEKESSIKVLDGINIETKTSLNEEKKKEPDTQKYNFKKSSFTDTDGQKYPTILMNGQWWMAKNLNRKTPDSYCYDDDPKNCEKYGRLYTWEAAQLACPKGWHLPSDKEWSNMLKTTFGKDGSCVECYDELTPGGRSGFAALLGGNRINDGEFFNLGEFGLYWSATEFDTVIATTYDFDKGAGRVYRSIGNKTSAFSCRCVKD